MRGIVNLCVLIALLLLVVPVIGQTPAANDGPWTPLVMVYTGDIGGKVEPCG